uniref:SHSP domain-containing protein n=1 Tax=Erpetoichthys calabaricus TaxID=27687 RepID=A0A8C4TCU2_ERPCA
MWSSSLFQPSFSAPLTVSVPVSALWPQSQIICSQMEKDVARHMNNMRRSVDLMNQLQHVLRSEVHDTDKVPRWAGGRSPFCKVQKDGQHFSAILEVEDFTPEQLTVKQLGRKVVEGGSYNDVNPEELSFSLKNGKLRIEASRMALPSVPERVVKSNPQITRCLPIFGCTRGSQMTMSEHGLF